MNNPMLSKLSDVHAISQDTASYAGVAVKSLGLVMIVIVSAIATWLSGYATYMTTMVTAVLGLVTMLVVTFKPSTAGLLSPLYAILEGMCLASISLSLNVRYEGIIINAIMLTFGIALSAGLVYAKGWVTVNDQFMRITGIAILGVLVVYLLEIGLGFFGIHFPMVHEGGPIGIGISLVIIGVAVMSLFTDYELISRSVRHGLPKDYEWYCAFSLLVTLIWLYVRVLDLLRKINDSR